MKLDIRVLAVILVCLAVVGAVQIDSTTKISRNVTRSGTMNASYAIYAGAYLNSDGSVYSPGGGGNTSAEIQDSASLVLINITGDEAIVKEIVSSTYANLTGDVFTGNVIINDTSRLYFFDEGGEYIDGTGADLNLVFGTSMKFKQGASTKAQVVGTGFKLPTIQTMQFRDSALVMFSSVDGQLDIDADVELEINAPMVDFTGANLTGIDFIDMDIISTPITKEGRCYYDGSVKTWSCYNGTDWLNWTAIGLTGEKGDIGPPGEGNTSEDMIAAVRNNYIKSNESVTVTNELDITGGINSTNVRLTPRSTSNLTSGNIYFDSDDNTFRGYNSTDNVRLDVQTTTSGGGGIINMTRTQIIEDGRYPTATNTTDLSPYLGSNRAVVFLEFVNTISTSSDDIVCLRTGHGRDTGATDGANMGRMSTALNRIFVIVCNTNSTGFLDITGGAGNTAYNVSIVGFMKE